MKRGQQRRIWGAAAIVLVCIVAIGWWQRQGAARLIVIAGVETLAHVRISFERSHVTANHAAFDGITVTSFHGEPVAAIAHLELAYDWHDLLAGKRRFGLKYVAVESPHLTVIRHSDGSYNVPVPQSSNGNGGAPLNLHARVRDGSVTIIDRSPAALPDQARLYVKSLTVDATLSTASRSTYAIALRYGEGEGRLYPIAGNGAIDAAAGYSDQHWTAAEIPIAGAVNFATNNPTMRLRSGQLENVDARGFSVRTTSVKSETHFVAVAELANGRIAVAGLTRPIENVHGRVVASDEGLLTDGLDAGIAGTPARVTGGVYGLRAPRLRLAVRGNGSLAQLRTAFAQAQRLPMRGRLDFTLLVEGSPTKPITWIALRSPQIHYAATSVDRIRGLVAFDGREADIVNFNAAYGAVDLRGRGRVALTKRPNAVEMLLAAGAPAGAAPYASRVLPSMPLGADVLATADDPKQIGLRGVLWGRSRTEKLDGIFDVDSRGTGSIGPLDIETDGGALYARVALDRPRASALGIVAARNFPIAPMGARLDATLFGEQANEVVAGAGNLRLASGYGAGRAHAKFALRNGTLHGTIIGSLGNSSSFGAILGGTPSAPRIAGTVVVAGMRYRDFNVNGNAGLVFDRSVLRVHDAQLALGPLFLGVAGTIGGLAPGALAPHYDLAARVHTSDVGSLVARVEPQRAGLVQGSLDANLHVDGSGNAPTVRGEVEAPEGSVNGLSFRDLRGAVAGDSAAFTMNGGRVVIGSSAIALSAAATRTSAQFAVDAPHLDLADLNDFFDAGDTLGGTGSLAVRANLIGQQIASTDGSASFSSARVRRIALGKVVAHWTSAGGTIESALRVGGPSGELALTGSITPLAKRVDLHADVAKLDLGSWLPMLGLNAPVTGRLDAQTDLTGTYPDVAMRLHAAMFGGTAGPLAIERFDLRATALHGRGTVESVVLDVPSLATTGSGTFGMRPDDSLSLVVKSTSPDIGAFLAGAGAKNLAVGGSFGSTLRIGGTLADPQLADQVAIESLRYGKLTLSRVAGEIDANRRVVALRNGEVDFTHGRALLAAEIPIHLARSGAGVAPGPIAASFVADDLELSNFADLLPTGTQLSGRITGRVDATGTARAPQFGGSLALRDGTFEGPMERSPITGITADVGLRGRTMNLQSRAFVGPGAVTARAVADLADLRKPYDTVFTLQAHADNARLDLPAYFQGTVNGNVTLARNGERNPVLSGDLSVSDARLPIAALLNQKQGPNAGPGLPNVAFDNVRIGVGRNVRVQSANVDVGATGAVALGGTLDAPTLAGVFHSTGGSLSFYRNFNLERADVRFDPASGIIPDVNAVATTFVSDPATAIRLHVTGAVTDMNLALESDPPYDREQILGLLVGAQQFGAVRGVQSSGGGSFSASSAAQSLALGQLNTVFTRNLLEPLSASLGGAFGFTEVQITSDIQTGLGVNAVKAFGKNVNAIFGESFGYPRTQSVALEAHPNVGTGLRLTAYTSTGPSLFAVQQPQPIAYGVLNLNPLTTYTPASGTSGVSFAFQRKFP